MVKSKNNALSIKNLCATPKRYFRNDGWTHQHHPEAEVVQYFCRQYDTINTHLETVECFMNKLAKTAPPRHLNIHVPLPRNVLLKHVPRPKLGRALCELPCLFCGNSHSDAAFIFCPDVSVHRLPRQLGLRSWRVWLSIGFRVYNCGIFCKPNLGLGRCSNNTFRGSGT